MKRFAILAYFLSAAVAWGTVVYGPAASPPVTNLSGRNVLGTAPTDTYVLTWDAALSSWKPAASASGFANPMNASGDIIYGGVAGAPTKLVKGSDGDVLTLASGVPSWAAPSGGGSPGGADTEVQFNASGSFDGDAGFFWDNSGKRLFVGNSTFSTADGSKLIISGDSNANIVTVRAQAGGTEGAFSMGSVNGGSPYAFIQGTDSALSAVGVLKINSQGGQLHLGGGASGLTFTGYTSCTALTTNGSDVVGCTPSDERLKKEITPFTKGLSAIEGLEPKSFKFKDPADKGIEHSAFIAQNVEKFIPEAVRYDSRGYMNVDYWTIIATQANAIKELSARVKALESAQK